MMRNNTTNIQNGQLIHIETQSLDGETVQTVSARELHSYLESKQQFGNWIASRIDDYGFIESRDFLIVLLKTSSGGRPRKEYHVSLDMAKELSMVERSEKGKEARRYFIECEKRAKNVVAELPNFNNPAIAARAWAEQYERAETETLRADQAVREKGQISNSREASVMGKLSQAVKKICRLETQVGDSETYKQAKAIGWLGDYFELSRVAYQQIGKKLTQIAADEERPPIEVEDTKYGKVKAYHIDVITSFKDKLDGDCDLLSKYRKEIAA